MQQTPDAIARSMGFKNADQMLAWQAHQRAIQNATDEVILPKAKPQPHPAAKSFLDSIMQYLPLGVLQKAGKAMDGK